MPVVWIDSAGKLTDIVKHLLTLEEISMDTEFDSFNRQYGIHLELIQVFDGTTCFLIDPLSIANMQPLWQVLEHTGICKVLYSGANDIDVLKRHDCNPKNLFDLQVAADLCRKTEKSLSALLQKEFNVELDKTAQRAGWSNRPLTDNQLLYARTDVVYLLQLRQMFLSEIAQKKLGAALWRENIKLESASSKDYFPKLSGKQKKSFSRYSQQKLLRLKLLVDGYAQELNLPPFKIVRDSFLEALIKDAKSFSLGNLPPSVFHPKVANNKQFVKRLHEIVNSIDRSIGWENIR